MTARRTLSLIGSWWVTAALVLSLVAAYLVFSFHGNPYPAWTGWVFHATGGIIVCLGLIANLAAASVRIAASRLAKPPLSPGYIRMLDVHSERPARDNGADDALRDMRELRGRWSFLPGTAVRLGVIVTLAALMVSAHARRTYDTVLSDGETKTVLGDSLTAARITADLPADHLQVGEDGTFELRDVAVLLRSDGRDHRVTPGFPARINGRWFRVSHLGYAQSLTVTLRGERSDVAADLDLLPPGRSSIVSLPSGSAFLTFALDPDRVITKGLLTGRQYNLAAPAYRVVVQEGRPRGNGQALRMRPGERGQVGAAEVALGRQGLFVRLQIVSDPGLAPLYAGIILLLAGLFAMPSRFFWYERETAVVVKDGVCYAGSRDEFFKKWGVLRFQRWSERLGSRNLP